MADGARTPRRRAKPPEETEEATRQRETSGWFVILKSEPRAADDPGELVKGLWIGEKLELVKVVEAPGKSSAHVARVHRGEVEEHWRQQRADAGPDADLPDQFPKHLYRVVPLGSYVPGHFAEEVRQTSFGTF